METGRTWHTSKPLLATMFLGNAAAMGQMTVVGKIVYDMTGSKFDLGLLGLVQFAPALVFVLLTGAIADRFDRRRVLAFGVAIQAITAVALGVYVGTKPTSALPIFLMTFATGTALAVSAPASRSLPADLVAPEDLPRLTAHASAAGQAGIVAGPVIGGFLYVAGIRLPFIAFAFLLVVAAFAVLAIRTGARRDHSGETAVHDAAWARQEAATEPVREPVMGSPDRGGLHAAMEGLRFVRTEPVVLGAISLDLFAVMFGGAVALLPAIAKDRLGVGAVGLGWLQASAGLGAGLMTLFVASRPVARRIGRTLFIVVAVFGVFTILLGLTRSYVVAFLAIFVLSAADAISVFIRATLVPLATPPDKRGRVLAVENVFIGASNELGGFESGSVAELIGTSGSVILGGVATIAIAGLWCVLFPALRQVDRFPDPSEMTVAAR